jgi:hypothetical protein
MWRVKLSGWLIKWKRSGIKMVKWQNKTPETPGMYWIQMPDCEPKLTAISLTQEGESVIIFAASPFTGVHDHISAHSLTAKGAFWCDLVHPDRHIEALSLLYNCHSAIGNKCFPDILVEDLDNKLEAFLYD